MFAAILHGVCIGLGQTAQKMSGYNNMELADNTEWGARIKIEWERKPRNEGEDTTSSRSYVWTLPPK